LGGDGNKMTNFKIQMSNKSIKIKNQIAKIKNTNQKFKFFYVLIILLLLLFFPNISFAQNEKFFEIKAQKFFYTPNIIKVNKGDLVRIRLISEDVHHGFYLDGYKIRTTAHPGKEGQLQFIANKTGRFSFRCSITCGEFHPYMIGYLYVEPNFMLYSGIFFTFLLGVGSLVVTFQRKELCVRPKLFGIIPLDWKFELTKFPIVRNLFKNRWMPFVPILVNLLVFSIIIFADFIGGFGPGNYNFGIMIVWILWWSLLMILMVPIIGRFWCMVCPFPMFGDWFQRGRLIEVVRQKLGGLNKRLPNHWKNLWPLVILFWVSTWFSGFFTVKPYASFLLIGGIIFFAVITALIFEKRTFCISVCPVSGFQGLYSNFSLCEVRVKNPEICKTHTPKTCVVGNEKGYGCPWMELPFEMNRNTYCGLCLECFKTCPYDNMAFNIRPFGADFLNERRKTDDIYKRRDLDESFKALTMIGIMFTFFMAMQGPFGHIKDMVRAKTLGGFFTYLAESFATDFLIIPITFFIFVLLSKIFSNNKEVKLRKIFVNFSYILVPVGLAVWAAFSFGIIFPNGSYIMHTLSDPFAWGWNLFGTAGFPWTPFLTRLMPYLQLLFILLGLLFAIDYGYKFSEQTYGNLEQAKRGWIPILVYLIAIHVFFVWLFVG
jgi:polyferredoxin